MTVPGGSTSSALLTGNAQVGAAQTGADSTNQANVSNNTNANISTDTIGTITNNVKANAESGDASAKQNTAVGEVKTGEAKATSSVANIVNSVLDVKHWFGVLVINVFGNWIGDINNNTSAGGSSEPSKVPEPIQSVTAAIPRVGLLAMLPHSTTGINSPSITTGVVAGQSVTSDAQSQQVLTAAAQKPADQKTAAQRQDMSILFALSALVMLIAGALASIDKKLKSR